MLGNEKLRCCHLRDDVLRIGGQSEGQSENLAVVVRCEELEKFGWESAISMALVATGMKIENATERPM